MSPWAWEHLESRMPQNAVAVDASDTTGESEGEIFARIEPEEAVGEQSAGEHVEADDEHEDPPQSSSVLEDSASTSTSSAACRAGLTAAVTLDMYCAYSSGET